MIIFSVKTLANLPHIYAIYSETIFRYSQFVLPFNIINKQQHKRAELYGM